MTANKGWIKYDIPSIMAYQNDLKETIEFIKDELPEVNWNSIPELLDYFRMEHNLIPDGTSIEALKELKENLLGADEYKEYTRDEDLAVEVVTGLIELKKIQSTIRNYTSQILKHADENGYYPLRLVDGEWLQQNKRPVSYLEEIKECIIEMYIPQEAAKGAKEGNTWE